MRETAHTIGVHEDRPVDEDKIDIVQPKGLETLVQALLDAAHVGGPDLGDDEDVLALDAGVKGLLEALADLVLVGVAVGAIDELVAVLEGKGHGRLDLTGGRLPGSCAQHGG